MQTWYEATMVVWTIRLSLLLYFAATILKVAKRGTTPACKGLWTAGGLLLSVHVILALGWAHQWSYGALYRATAEDTARVTGSYWGGGLFFNFAMVLMWLADIVWWWRDPGSYAVRHPVYGRVLHGFFLFMIFNATVVFESGLIRWGGLTLLVVLGLAWLFSIRKAGAPLSGKTPG